jgi:hypothetical protein
LGDIEVTKAAGRDRLLGPIGEGGMGVVRRVHDELLDRVPAVTEVCYPARTAEWDRTFFDRFWESFRP